MLAYCWKVVSTWLDRIGWFDNQFVLLIILEILCKNFVCFACEIRGSNLTVCMHFVSSVLPFAFKSTATM